MNFIILSTIAFIVTCIILSAVAWLFVKARTGSAERSKELQDRRAEDLIMQAGDWINATVNVVIGVLLGVVIVSLFQLITTAFWPVAVFIPLLAAAVFFFWSLIDRLAERVFPSGIRPAHSPQQTRRVARALRHPEEDRR